MAMIFILSMVAGVLMIGRVVSIDRPAVPRRKRCRRMCAVSPHLITKQRGEHVLNYGGTGSASLQNERRESHYGFLISNA
jgi:hypothetical protein